MYKYSISSLLDLDREIVYRLDDYQPIFLLNKYFYYKVCNDVFIRRKLASYKIQDKIDHISWKLFYNHVNYYVKKMQAYNYKYKSGDYYQQCSILSREENNQEKFLIAIRRGEYDLVKFFVEEHFCKVSYYYDLPLNWACYTGHLEIVKYLVGKEADVRILKDNPLRWACEKGHLPVVKYLIQQGCRPESQEGYFFNLAITNGHGEIYDYLKNCK